MNVVKFKILSDDDIRLIHEKSLELLESTGVVLKSKVILDRMADAGCKVDYDRWTIRFPADIVTQAIESTPGSLVLGGLEEKNNLELGSGKSYLTTDGQGCFVVDLENGKRRSSTLKDIEACAIIADNLDYIDMFWPPVSANDAVPEVRTLEELTSMYRYTGKHVQTDIFHAKEVPYFINVLETVLGSIKEVKDRKIFSVVCCPVTPLQYEEQMMEAHIELVEYDIPINILPMPIAGATSPITLLSAVLLNNIEVLGALAIFQTFKQGAPLIYGSSASILDMRSGLFAVGAPEEGLINGACAEMAKFYKIPCLVSGFSSDAKEPGIQAAMEKLATGLTPWLCGTDILGGVGLVETCQCLYFEQLIIDEEIYGFIKRIREGIKGGQENLLSDVIAEVGPGGHFLSQKSTKTLLRQGEHYIPRLISREPFDKWEHSNKRDLVAFARGKVKEILDQPCREYLDKAVVSELAAIVKSAEKTLSS
jgi:trimethylamine---corrinoid protein Co-methyltransferase